MADKKITPKRPGTSEENVPLSRVTERPEEERRSLGRVARKVMRKNLAKRVTRKNY